MSTLSVSAAQNVPTYTSDSGRPVEADAYWGYEVAAASLALPVVGLTEARVPATQTSRKKREVLAYEIREIPNSLLATRVSVQAGAKQIDGAAAVEATVHGVPTYFDDVNEVPQGKQVVWFDGSTKA